MTDNVIEGNFPSQRGQTCKRIPWGIHKWHMDRLWKPGDHVAVVAPTDWGKTYLTTKGLMPLWPEDYPYLLVDVKGDDPSLEGVGKAVAKLPAKIWRRGEKRQVYRLVVPETVDAFEQARGVILQALRTARKEKGWVIHLNEVKALTDARRPGLNLSPYVEQLWLRGRPHVTVISETQAPAWVPRAMYQQATHVYLGFGLDEDYRKRLGEVGGNRKVLVEAMDSLREHEFIYVHRPTGTMSIVKV